MKIVKIIEIFRRLDLSKYPEKEIRDLLINVGFAGCMTVTLHEGKSIIRARPNYNGERFSNKSDFSYKPQENNCTYQRASTPHNTMFYGSILPEDIKEGELDNVRIIGLMETVPLLRNKDLSGYQKISFGRWFVKEDINLISVVHNKSFYNKSSFTKELFDDYQLFCQQTSPEIIEEFNMFQEYIASEFAKENTNEDYQYMISAIYSELVTKLGYDGVIYPSVRVSGEGFNIAITPEATRKLELRVAGECAIYKRKDIARMGLNSIIQLDGSEDNFILDDSNNDEKEMLAKFGLTSIYELV